MVGFGTVVVANRGAVAARIIRALRELGVSSVAVYSDADAGARYLEEADAVAHIGQSPPRASYLNREALLAVIDETGADAVHPGYGFLAEDPGFADAVGRRGVTWIGPSPRWIELMGNKARAREFARSRGWPLAPGSEPVGSDPEQVMAAAREVGFPVMVKPAGGGGGIGMFPAHHPDELLGIVERASALADRSFDNPAVYLERLVVAPRHVEYQILADRHGDVCHLFERDCSVQRRHQKIIEEAPAPGLDRGATSHVADTFVDDLRDAGYDGIGTIETLFAGDASHFLEMNTRLQVEHGVTEEVTGIDLVRAQVRLAAGDPLSAVVPDPPRLRGHAVEARVYAEDPIRFLPSPGRLSVFEIPAGVRVETGVRQGDEITTFYDPLLAKVIAHGDTRRATTEALAEALEAFEIRGVKTNIPALVSILRSKEFIDGRVHTDLADEVVRGERTMMRSTR